MDGFVSYFMWLKEHPWIPSDHSPSMAWKFFGFPIESTMYVAVTKRGLTLTKVTVQRQPSSVTVMIRGLGEIHYRSVVIHASQLALDFSDSISSLQFDTLQVGHPLLKDIRIEQYSEKLRLVFALGTRVRYAIKVHGAVLVVQFK